MSEMNRTVFCKPFLQKGLAKNIASKDRLSDKTIAEIQDYIKSNYRDIYKDWLASGGTPGFYNK